MSAWMHIRKGRIDGTIEREDDTWAHIRLATDHELSYGSEINCGRIDSAGELLTVRKTHLTPIECTCFVTPESTWFRYGSAVEPGSQMEYNPDCLVHKTTLSVSGDEAPRQVS